MVGVKITPDYVSQYLLENIRAELCHFYTVIFALPLLLITEPRAWFFIITYTFILNVPCILIQRFNRPRFERLIKTRDEKGNLIFPEFWKNANGDSLSGREEWDEKRRKLRQKKKEARLKRKLDKRNKSKI